MHLFHRGETFYANDPEGPCSNPRIYFHIGMSRNMFSKSYSYIYIYYIFMNILLKTWHVWSSHLNHIELTHFHSYFVNLLYTKLELKKTTERNSIWLQNIRQIVSIYNHIPFNLNGNVNPYFWVYIRIKSHEYYLHIHIEGKPVYSQGSWNWEICKSSLVRGIANKVDAEFFKTLNIVPEIWNIVPETQNIVPVTRIVYSLKVGTVEWKGIL